MTLEELNKLEKGDTILIKGRIINEIPVQFVTKDTHYGHGTTENTFYFFEENAFGNLYLSQTLTEGSGNTPTFSPYIKDFKVITFRDISALKDHYQSKHFTLEEK